MMETNNNGKCFSCTSEKAEVLKYLIRIAGDHNLINALDDVAKQNGILRYNMEQHVIRQKETGVGS